jgi:hypothetical protein
MPPMALILRASECVEVWRIVEVDVWWAEDIVDVLQPSSSDFLHIAILNMSLSS